MNQYFDGMRFAAVACICRCLFVAVTANGIAGHVEHIASMTEGRGWETSGSGGLLQSLHLDATHHLVDLGRGLSGPTNGISIGNSEADITLFVRYQPTLIKAVGGNAIDTRPEPYFRVTTFYCPADRRTDQRFSDAVPGDLT